MKWINYNHLFYFYTIANEKSVIKAAKKLRLAQSTLSMQLKQFEEQLGTTLFNRSHRSLVLTEKGKRVLEYAKEIFSLGNELKDWIFDQKEESQPKVQIGVLDMVPKTIIEDLVTSIWSKHNATISIVEARLEGLTRELEEFKIDAILSNRQIISASKSQLFHRKLGGLPVAFVGAPHYQALLKGGLSALSKVKLALPTKRDPYRIQIEDFLTSHQITPHICIEVDDVELQRRLALKGNVLTALPLHLVAKDIKEGKLVALTKPIFIETLWWITASRKYHNVIIKWLFENFKIS